MRSIKTKLIMLGAVSIVCTIILGLVGIFIMNSNNANNQVLNDINNINLKQNENTTQETSFLYDLDLSHYQTIQSNLAFMSEAAAGRLPTVKGKHMMQICRVWRQQLKQCRIIQHNSIIY